jgi:Fe-S-cluster containining protein
MPTGTKAFSIEIETPDGRLPPAQVIVPDGPLGLAHLVEPIYGLCDGIVNLAIRKAVQSEGSITCHSGCGACCRQMVPVSIPEAFYLWHETISVGIGTTPLIDRFSSCRRVLEQNGLWKKLEHCSNGKEQVEAAAEYWSLSIPCPYLVNESCSIYPSRPCACREYNVLSAPSLCTKPMSSHIKRLVIHRRLTTALSKTAGDVLSSAPILIPLAQIPQWCEAHRELDTMRWDGIQLFELMLFFASKG